MRTLKCLLVVAIVAIAAPYASAQCTPPGWTSIGGGGVGYYNWIANGQPGSTTICWSSTAPIVTATDCGQSQKTFNFDTYNDELIQFVDIPADRHETHFDLTYLLTMNDPNHDGTYTYLKAEVLDVTDGVMRASQTYWGSDASLTCGRRDLTFDGDYAGHTFRIRFKGGPFYSGTVIHVRSIGFLQSI